MIEKIKNWLKAFFSKTPSEKNAIKREAGYAIVVLAAIQSGTTGATPPEWFTNYVWYAYAALAILICWAQGFKKDDNGPGN